MPDYKRLVSYMYNYEDGMKKNNVGYARVEARNGQCKCTLHIAAPSLNDKQLKVYIFKSNKGELEGIQLGTLQVKNGIGEFKTVTDSVHIMNSSYSLDDMGGIVLYLTERKFLATSWNETPITMNMVAGIEGRNNDTDLKAANMIADKIDAAAKDKQKKADEDQNQQEGEVFNDLYPDNDLSDNEGSNAEDKLALNEVTAEVIKDRGPIEGKEANQEEVNCIQVNDVERNNVKAGEDLFKCDDKRDNDFNKAKEFEDASEYKELNSLGNTVNYNSYDTLKDPANYNDFGIYEENENYNNQIINENDLSNEMQSDVKIDECGTNNEKQAFFEDHPLAKRIYRSFPRMYPFEDNEIAWCVRIEPQDIGLFPMEAWILGNNSFLLHGFYSYRHLIFARMNDKNGISYILGVPGIYHNREKFMAKMFGFENFKCVKRKAQRTGEFGYWYIPITLAE